MRNTFPALVLGGGVGPLAGVHLHEHIIRTTPTVGDSGHIDIWHISDVRRMPDRTAYLQRESGENPGPVMAENVMAIGTLLAARRQPWLTAVPCATFHAPAIFQPFRRAVEAAEGCVRVLNIVDETVHSIEELSGAPRRIGVLSTLGSHRAGVWRLPLLSRGFSVIEGDAALRTDVHDAIYNDAYGLKAVAPPTDKAADIVLGACKRLLHDGAEVIVLGCTELPLVWSRLVAAFMGSDELCDPLRVLANAIVREALGGRESFCAVHPPATVCVEA